MKAQSYNSNTLRVQTADEDQAGACQPLCLLPHAQGLRRKEPAYRPYLSYSFDFYRRASESCARAIQQCEKAGWTSVGLYGASDLAEIAAIRAAESRVKVKVVCDSDAARSSFVSITVIPEITSDWDVDAWILTDFLNPVDAIESLARQWPRGRIVVPDILSMPKK